MQPAQSLNGSQVPRAPKLRRLFRIAKAFLIMLLAPVLAILVLPVAWIVHWLARASRPIELPDDIPSRTEMKALGPHVARGNADALRLWLRGAFFRQLVEAHGMGETEAAMRARQLADLANVQGGYKIGVEVPRG